MSVHHHVYEVIIIIIIILHFFLLCYFLLNVCDTNEFSDEILMLMSGGPRRRYQLNGHVFTWMILSFLNLMTRGRHDWTQSCISWEFYAPLCIPYITQRLSDKMPNM